MKLKRKALCLTLALALLLALAAPAAAADVTEIEPLPAGHPLWKLPNMVLTPHISGGYHLPGTQERIADICIGNLDAWLHGGKLRNVIDFETGYKK